MNLFVNLETYNLGKKILFWGRWIDDILLGSKPPDGIGGAEVQMALWSVITGKNDNKVYSFGWRRASIHKVLYGVRFIPWPWGRKIGVFTRLLRFMFRFYVNPDVVIIRSSSDLSFLINQKIRANFLLVLMLAHDHDVKLPYAIERHGKDWFRRLAFVDLIVAQNDFQASELKKHLGHNFKLHMQPNIFFTLKESNRVKHVKRFDFVWVGTLKESKRPELFIQLAESLPEYSFGMIGHGFDSSILGSVTVASSRLSNFNYLGYKSYDESINFISGANVVVSTSLSEGFPNIFLQAWYYNIPVISFVNPNDSITKFGLGIVFQEYEELEQAAIHLVNDKNSYEKVQQNIKTYFAKTHDAQRAYESLMEKLEEC